MKRTYIAAALLACAAAPPLMAADYIYYYPTGTTVAPNQIYVDSQGRTFSSNQVYVDAEGRTFTSNQVYVVRTDSSLMTVQQRLRDIGYKDVRVNGILESRTTEAVKLFQQEQGYPATGVLDQRTLSLLGVSVGGSGSVGGVPVIVSSETPVYVSPRVEYLPSQY